MAQRGVNPNPLPLCRVLLWHRSDNLCFALVLGGDAALSVGAGVECKIKGVLQVGRCVGGCKAGVHDLAGSAGGRMGGRGGEGALVCGCW